MSNEKRASGSGSLAFVWAASASAVGLGNLWRFPYLAAKYGGGVFIAVYLILSLTLGFTLLITEIALGRYSRQSQLTAFRQLGHPRWNFLGVLSTIIPLSKKASRIPLQPSFPSCIYKKQRGRTACSIPAVFVSVCGLYYSSISLVA